VTEMEAKVLAALRQLNQEMARVFSYDVAAEVEKCARTARYHLNKMLELGLVQYSRGGGWVAA
jgi:Mn-dependent DtxR family transcriptional regulator